MLALKNLSVLIIFIVVHCCNSSHLESKNNKKLQIALVPHYRHNLKNNKCAGNLALMKDERSRCNKRQKVKRYSYYSNWSKWSSCTKSCTTQRYRWCRKPGICGRDVMRESAYCYVEKSFCQTWIRQRIKQGIDDDDTNSSSSSSSSSSTNDAPVNEFELNTTTNNKDQPDDDDDVDDDDLKKCGVAGGQNNPRLSYSLRIIGGQPALPGDWPWQVAILNRYREAFCGGTLISQLWVLTAAHCVRKRLFVRLGEYDLTVNEGTELELQVDLSVIHPDYDPNTVDNDVGLLRIPSPSRRHRRRRRRRVPTACLPAPNQPVPVNQFCTIIGWGKSRATDDVGTDVLHQAKIPIVSTRVCREMYKDYRITDNMFCAGYRGGRMDSCAGDSGGPLLCRDQGPNQPWIVFGVTSFGEGCGKRDKLGIYAKLTNYVTWIKNITAT